jgi:hypothetical protein
MSPVQAESLPISCVVSGGVVAAIGTIVTLVLLILNGDAAA